MKIRVLHVLETIGSGGVERVRLAIAKQLDQNKFEQKIVCSATVGPLVDEFQSLGVEVIPIGSMSHPLDIGKYRKVLRVIKSYKPHIIHGAVFEGVTQASIAGFLGKVPVVILEETSDPQNRSSKATLLLRGLSFLADKIIGVSPSVFKYLSSEANIQHRKLVLINNGVPIPSPVNATIVEELRREYYIKPEDFVVGSVGRLRNFHKRFTDLIEALSILKSDYPNLKVMIVGDGGDREFIEDFAAEKGLADRVVMVGFQSDPHPFYELMDAFALVSHMEAFGLVAVEAMLHKLPVVASNVGGLKDVVLDNSTGILIEPHHPKQIAEAISKLISDPERRHRMGQEGYKRAISEFTAERYVGNIERLYNDMLKTKGIF